MKLCCLPSFASAFLVASLAAAASPTVTLGTITRTLPDGTAAATRDEQHHPSAINASDCEDDVILGADVTVSGVDSLTSYKLQAWAGESCWVSAYRNGGAPLCWPVTPTLDPTSKRISIHARDIVSGDNDIVTVSDDTTSPPRPYSPAGASACEGSKIPNGYDFSGLAVWVTLVDSAGAWVGNFAEVLTPPALQPAPTTDLPTLTPTDRTIHVESNGPFLGDWGAFTIVFHCAPAAEGSPPTGLMAETCATASGMANVAELEALAPSTTYAVCASIVDDYGNPGPCSETQYVTTLATPSNAPSPAPADSSGCSASPARSGNSLAGLGLAGLAVGLFGVRRRKRLHVSCRAR